MTKREDWERERLREKEREREREKTKREGERLREKEKPWLQFECMTNCPYSKRVNWDAKVSNFVHIWWCEGKKITTKAESKANNNFAES